MRQHRQNRCPQCTSHRTQTITKYGHACDLSYNKLCKNCNHTWYKPNNHQLQQLQ